MGSVRFLLNDQWQEITAIDPKTSVLDYLREHLGLVGTKEGCASGDCGACTVVLGTVSAGQGMEYKATNSCITPVATLHGKQLITVEHLQQGGQLHPVQQAMVDHHGSQCGFCTPGFVMSLFAMSKDESSLYEEVRQHPSSQEVQREQVLEALSGNLCRCTGYRPIIDAALDIKEQLQLAPINDCFARKQAKTVAELKAIANQPVFFEYTRNGNRKRYFSPTSVAELAEILAAYSNARLVAGGTDLSLEFTQALKDVDVLVYLGRVAEMRGLTESDNHIEIGAAVTYSEVRDTLVGYYPDMAELIDRLGSRQVRNQGTIGGNIGNASPIGDMPPVLLALGASVVLRHGDQQRELPLERFFIDYKQTALRDGEFIERIRVPKPVDNQIFRVYKISKRIEDDISATCAAFNVFINNNTVEDIRTGFGGMAAIPKSAKNAEKILRGGQWHKDAIEKAQQALRNDFSPLSDFRASAEYRMRVSQNLFMRFYLESQQGADIVRVTQHA